MNAAIDLKLERAMPWALIAACCLASFAAASSGTTRAPLLLAISGDLAVPMPLVANLVSLTAIAWGITSALGGWLSDRFGRRVLLVVAPLVLAVTMALQAQADTFVSLAAWAVLSGGSCGTFMGVLFAEVSAHVADRQRGRALGWVMSGQSLALVIGVPMAAAVGAMVGWRGWFLCVAAVALASSVALLMTVPKSPTRAAGTRRNSLKGALSARIWGLLGCGVIERVCYGLAAVYYPTFLQVTYDLSLVQLAIPLLVFAIGNVVGTILGGQLADRLYDRLLTFTVAMALSGFSALALFLWHPGVAISVALGFIYVFLNAAGRPSLMAAYAAVPDQVRGTVMGLTGTAASVGWIGAAGLGAAMIGLGGFGGFGPLGLVLGLACAAGALWCRRPNTSLG
ncbi:MAG: MFS transporter [Proteobacteria bacterium]|nr:MFS transporter [Pseudomonadota bacterium]